MNINKIILGLMASALLVGCGGGGGGGGGDDSIGSNGGSSGGGNNFNNNNNSNFIAVGEIIAQVTNPALPAGTTSLSYEVQDQNGNVVSQQTFSYTGGAPPFELLTNVPAETDTLTVQALNASNQVIIQGSASVYVGVDAAPTANVTLGDPRAVSQIAFISQPANVVVGAPMSTLVVGLVDATNNLAVSATNNVTLTIANNPGGASLGGTLQVTPVFGLATFTGLTLNQLGSGYTITASCSVAANTTTNGFNVVSTAGTPTQLVFTVNPYPQTTINVPFAPAPQVAVEDANGVIVNGASNTINLGIGNNPGGDSIAGTATLNAAQGLATFSGISLNGQGTAYTLTAQGTGLVTGTSTPFTMLFDQSGVNPQTGDGTDGDVGDGNGLNGDNGNNQ